MRFALSAYCCTLTCLLVVLVVVGAFNATETEPKSYKNGAYESGHKRIYAGIPAKKFRRFSSGTENANVERGNCSFAEEISAKILLLNHAEGVSNILKANPRDRNDKLIELLHRVSDIKFREDRGDSEIAQISDEKLDELSVRLADFLSLRSEDEYDRDFDRENPDVADEIRRLLYLNPARIEETLKLYAGGGKVNIGGMEEDSRCLDPAGNKTVLAVKTDGSGTGATQKFDDVDTTTDEENKGEEDAATSAKGLQFLDVPDGDDMRVHNLKLEDESAVFAAFSFLVSYLQPDEFPLGLARDAFKQDVPPHILALQILKLEGLALCWVLFWAILSLCLPCAVVAQMCCPKRNIQRLRDDASSASTNLNNKCTGRTAGSVLYILMLSLLFAILLMLASNDKFSRAIEKSPNVASVVFKDLETYIKNTQLQMSFVATSSFEITVDQINKDLQDVEELLGNSFKKDFVAETGFDEIIDELIKLKSGAAEVSRRARDLLRECGAAKGAGEILQEALSELSRQLNVARRYCTQKDRSLCESVQSTGLDLAFSMEELIGDPNLRYLERITNDNKFNGSIDEAVGSLNGLPRHAERETASRRAGIVDLLQLRRRQMYHSVRSLEEIAKSMTISVRTAGQDVLYLVRNVASRDLWRYLIVLATSLLTFIVWVLFLCGSPCCCHYTKKTILYLKLGICITCLLTVVLWICGSIAFLIGGHGQTIVCDPLYEDRFHVLSNILDEDGFIYKEGYFTHILKSNDSLKTEDILRNCQRNQPSYTTFRLENRIDISKIFNYQSWDDLRGSFDEFRFTTEHLRVFPSNLERNLEEYASAASKNKFRDIRGKVSFPVTHKDLHTFYDQIYSVTKQIANTKSAVAFEKVMIKTQDIANNELKTVENHRDSILYKLTALEILLQPINLKIQVYLARLTDVQIFLEDNGDVLAEKHARNYVFRLERHLHELQKHVNDQIRRKIGKCKPLWDLFFFVRQHLCKAIVDPVNALSCSHFIAILVFLCMVPLVINLIGYYKEVSVHLPESLSDGPFDQELSMRDQAIWTTPQSGSSSSRNDNLPSLPTLGNEESRWTSPSFPAEPPPPPRPPSISSMTRVTPRLVGLYTIAKAKSVRSKYDPLKFIERTWKTPRSSQSPRGWL